MVLGLDELMWVYLKFECIIFHYYYHYIWVLLISLSTGPPMTHHYFHYIVSHINNFTFVMLQLFILII